MSEMSQRKVMFNQILCLLPLFCVFFMVGVGRCWIAPIVNEATDPHSELPLTSVQCSWMASLGYASRCISPFLLFLVVDRVGRVPVIVFNAIIFSGMWIVVYWSRDVVVHYIVRLACGLSDGLQDTIVSIYVCENCSPQYRGTFFTIGILVFFTGQCFVFVLATLCSYNTSAIIYAVLGVLTLLSTVLLVEPAQFFLMKGDTTKAERNFARLRDMNNPDHVKEFENMKKYIAEEKLRKVSLQLYTSKEVARGLRSTLVMMLLASGCGWGPVYSFVTKLFSNSNDGISANQLSIFYGLLQLVCVFFSSFIMDRYNRRTLMMIAAAFLFIIHSSIIVLYCVQPIFEIPCFQSILFFMVTTFACISAMFLLPLMGLIRGELLPQSVKVVGTGLSTLFISVTSFTLIRSFLPIAEIFGYEFNFAIYACSALSLAVYTYFDIPETRGRTLVEIQNELKGIKEQKLEFSHL